jgi:beta-lactamase class D
LSWPPKVSFQFVDGVMLRLNEVLLLVLLLGVVLRGPEAEHAVAAELRQTLQTREAAVAVVELRTGAFYRYDEERCRKPFPALATVQVPVALLALDAGLIKDAQTVLTWNRLKYPLPEDETAAVWGQDHTLRSAFQQTVPWYFQEIAQRLGPAALQRSLTKMKYGQPDVPFTADAAALGERLTISIEQQLSFLHRLYEMRLPLSKQAQRTVRDLLIHEQTPRYTLRSVAGDGMLDSGKSFGWLVGWLEARDSVCVFALNLTGPDSESVRAPARQLLQQVLTELGYWPPEGQNE